MNPHIIKLLMKGHEEKIREQDYLFWLSNQYTLSAVSVAVEHCLAGNKAKSKYIDKLILQEAEQKQAYKSDTLLTEDEKKQQTERLFMKLRIMGANFNINHNKDDSVS